MVIVIRNRLGQNDVRLAGTNLRVYAVHQQPVIMVESIWKAKAPRFPGRLFAALRNSLVGYRQAIATESAIREELIAVAILAPISLLVPVSRVEHLLLLLSLMLVVLVELLNTAIEATVDRISMERHPLAGQAKDLGSAAVLTALLMTGLCWAMIVGPVVLRWWRG